MVDLVKLKERFETVPGVVEIPRSKIISAVLLFGCLAAVAASFLIVYLSAIQTKFLTVDFAIRQFAGWFSVGFFGLCLRLAYLRFKNIAAPAYCFTKDGLMYGLSFKPFFIPWDVVSAVSESRVKSSKFVVLEMSKADYASLGRHKIYSKIFALNCFVIWRNGFPISALGTKLSHSELLTLTTSYVVNR